MNIHETIYFEVKQNSNEELKNKFTQYKNRLDQIIDDKFDRNTNELKEQQRLWNTVNEWEIYKI